MKRFRFPLARVLELRRRELEAAQARVAGLRSRRGSLEAEAARLSAECRATHAQILSKPVLTGRELSSVSDYVNELDRRRRLSIEAARRIGTEEAAAVRAALEARRKVRLLEILESKRRREHRAAFDREQEALLADLFLAGISRRGNPPAPADSHRTATAGQRVLPPLSPPGAAIGPEKTL